VPLPSLLTRLGGYLGRRLYTDETLVLLRWESTAPSPPPHEGTTVRRADSGSLGDLAAFDTPTHRQVFADYLAAGDVGYLAYRGGRCVHRVFATPGPATVHLHAMLPHDLAADEVFVHSGRTAPDARGLGAAPAAAAAMVADLGPDRRYLTAIDARNRPALRASRRVGVVEEGRIRVRVVGGLRLVWRGGPGQDPATGPELSRVHLRPRGHTRGRVR